MKIALAGNPNSGKTTMFNALTGKNERVGNWAGVTVEKKVHTIKKTYSKGRNLTAVDLPGAYSMSPFTSEESVARDYIQNENPDVIINIVDATNLSRSLFFTTQLLELGVPMVVALNKTDLNERKNTEINTELLSQKLGCPVLRTVSTSAKGLGELVDTAAALYGKKQKAPFAQKSCIADETAAQAADRERFSFVNAVVTAVEQRTVRTMHQNAQDKIDAIITGRLFGIPIFALVMAFVFAISQHEKGLGVLIADFLTAGIDALQGWAAGFFEGANPLLSALLVDGIIGGVGAVVGFLPLVMVMYFFIALLEDCGYMARVSVVLDPIFKKAGLSGKSVIPFVIGTGCAVPGVMACRTIHDERERRTAAMLTPFMPCGAKLPVISLFAGAFFENASRVGTLMYFVGIMIIFIGALLVNRITGNSRKKSYFIIELPEYKWPSLKRAFLSMCQRGRDYVVKAATVILLCNTAVQIMQSFGWNLRPADSADASILASVAAPFAYLLLPVVGVVSWQLAAAVLTGFIAKENVIGTLAVCFVGLENLLDAEELSLLDGSAAQAAGVLALSKAAALAYLMFNLFSPPCFAAIGAMRSEMKSRKWFFAGIGLQLSVGYILAFSVYQIGTFFTTGQVGAGFVPGLIFVLAVVGVLAALCHAGKKKSSCAEVLEGAENALRQRSR